MSDINVNIGKVREKIDEIVQPLICDEWDMCEGKIFEIINDLSQIIKCISEMEINQKIIELQQHWLVVVDVILKAVELKDSVQTADLLQYDLGLVLDMTASI